jgi:hypothetical protein
LRLTISHVTLRSVKEGWKATGLLKPLWMKLDPPGAETLTALSGVPTKALYSYNSGKKNIGMVNAEKIAAALDLSIYDLGATRPMEQTFATSLLGQIVSELEQRPPLGDPSHLRELADELRDLASRVDAVADGRDADLPPV